jgi:hypothetical protein
VSVTLFVHAHPERRVFPWYLRLLAWPLRRAAVGVAVLAVAQRRVLRSLRGLPWKLQGDCRSCGRCCENLLLEVSNENSLSAALRNFWHECVFDFYRKGNVLEDGAQRYATYGCHNFTSDRRCAKYALRPLVCRAYPALALFDRPTPRAHCGFKVIDQ